MIPGLEALWFLPGIELFGHGFMQRALIAGLLVGLVGSVLGVFLVLRGAAMMGDSLAHIGFGGLALGVFLGVATSDPAIFLVALAFAAGAGLGIELLRARGVVFTDTAIAIFFTGGLAFGVLVLDLAGGLSVDLFSLLFGSPLTVTWGDVGLVALLSGLVVAVVALLRKELFYLTFSEEAARVSGLPVGALNAVVAILTAVAIVVSIRVVGILLVSALLVVPAATTLQFVRSFAGAILASAAVALAVVAAGLYLSVLLDMGAGGAIALTSVATFFAATSLSSLAKRAGAAPA